MSQLSFASLSPKKKSIRSEIFLNEMKQVIPWDELLKLIVPYYCDGQSGRKPMPLERMLRIYFLQQWFSLGDPSIEEAIYDRISFQRFLKIDLMNDRISDETTILNFRHLLEAHDLPKKILKKVNELLEKKGILLKRGSIVDATLIKASTSRKNKDSKRDPEMSFTKKDGNVHFEMKFHIAVDTKSGLIHSAIGTTAKVADKSMFFNLLYGGEEAVFGDKAYVSREDKRLARDAGIYWGILDRRGPGKQLSSRQKKRNQRLSSIRSKVEYPFQVFKRLWGYSGVRYKGLKKKCAQLLTLSALHNLYKVRK